MSAHSFALQPFLAMDRAIPGMEIAGTIERNDLTLAIHYVLTGRLLELIISEPSDPPVRKSRLWEHTCFELFVAPGHATQYWEFNCSTSGHWNVYRFLDYRQGMQEERALSLLPFQVQRGANELTLILKTSLDGIAKPEQSLDIGVSAVLRHRSGALSYWALTHTGLQPDFHRRDGFLLKL